MEQISWRSDLPYPRPVVPFLCEDRHDEICDRIESLSAWPDLMQWNLDPDQDESVAISAARCQAWLFFGLLRTMTAMTGDRFDIDDFVTPLRGRKIVSSANVPALLERFSGRAFVLVETAEKDTRNGKRLWDELEELLLRAIPWIMRVVRKHEQEHNASNIWNWEIYNVFLSTLLLIEDICDLAIDRNLTLAPVASDQCKAWIQHFVHSTRTLHESFKELGHCVSLLRRIDTSLSTACKALALPAEADSDHSGCGVESCVSYNVSDSYVPRHAKGCDRCSLLRIDTVTLDALVERKSIPLIRSTLNSNKVVSVEVVDGTNISDYAAISHVWAGGLGNLRDNAHYQCQLKQIHVDLAGLRQSTLPYKTTTIFYWLDTLCIPTHDGMLHDQAIHTMAQIYAGSKTVLVIDPSLDNRHAVGMSEQELDLAVLCSPWMARSWTLQEGALAVDVFFRFADKAVSFEQLKLVGGQTRRTSVQSLYSRDVDRIMPRACSRLAFERFSRLGFIFGRGRGCDPVPTPLVEYLMKETRDHFGHDNFKRAWNELSRRTTSKPTDVSTILGTLVERSASEVLALPEATRIQALLRTQKELPRGLLFAPVDPSSPTWSPRPPSGGQHSHVLRPIDGSMSLLPSGVLRIDDLDNMLALRSLQPVSLHIEEAFVSIPAVDFHCHIKFDDYRFGQCDTAERHLVLLFHRPPRGVPHYSNGSCFTLDKTDEDGLHLRYVKSFTFDCLSSCCNKEHRCAEHECRPQVLQLSTIDFISAKYPLFIDMNIKWPELSWSRPRSYPFTAKSRKAASRLHLFDVIFQFMALATLVAMFNQFMSALMVSGQTNMILVIATVIADLAFLVLCEQLFNIEYNHLRDLTNSVLHQRWAASFSPPADASKLKSKSKAPVHVRTYMFYTTLFMITCIPTAIMFTHLPTIQNLRHTRLQYSMVTPIFLDFLFETKPNGSPRAWHIFIIRHACKRISVELLLRGLFISVVELKDFVCSLACGERSREHTDDANSNAAERFRARFGPAKLFRQWMSKPHRILCGALQRMVAATGKWHQVELLLCLAQVVSQPCASAREFWRGLAECVRAWTGRLRADREVASTNRRAVTGMMVA